MPAAKKAVTKKPIKTKAVEKKIATTKPVKTSGLSVSVYSLAGRAAPSWPLPKEIFGVKVNKSLLAQAIRVYTTNQSKLLGHTKTRGQVEGSTAKIYRQKGTGKARHGSVRAPIFVGGGIVFGPKTRNVKLDLPKKMKRAALINALSSKASDKNIYGLSGIEKATGKTKEIITLLQHISPNKKKITSTLFLVDKKTDNVVRGVRNIKGVSVLHTDLINAYDVLKHDVLLITKEAIEKLATPKIEETK